MSLAEPLATVTPVADEAGVIVSVLLPPIPTGEVALLPNVRLLIVRFSPKVVLAKLAAVVAVKITSVVAPTLPVALVPPRFVAKLLMFVLPPVNESHTPSLVPFQ